MRAGFLALLTAFLTSAADVSAQDVVRLQEVASINGIQANHLMGVGIVVGLAGTGDSNAATRARLASFLAFNKINVDAGQLAAGNVALVSVSCEIPPFLREGDRVDITLSAIQDATSLFGGELLFTTLKGIDGEVYVVAQGPVSIGGFSSSGSAAKLVRNHPTVGHVPGGGIVEKTIPMRILTPTGDLEIRILRPAFDTAVNISRSISTLFPGRVTPVDPGLVRVHLTEAQKEPGRLMEIMAKLVNLPVQVGGPSKVVINERTGTIVIGEHVRIGKCALAKGNLTITVTENPVAVPRSSLTEGETTVLPRTSIEAVEGKNNFMLIKGGASLADVAEVMNQLGASPRDIIEIFQALSRAGVLHARLEIM